MRSTPIPLPAPAMEKTASPDIETQSADRATDTFQPSGDAAAARSDQRLRELGYKSEFRREFSVRGLW